MESTPLEPTSPDERIELFDVLRGFALFGVLVSNIVQVATDYLVVPAETRAQLPTAAVDTVATHAFRVLIYGKFMIIFGLLFGLGFAVQRQRAQARGASIGHVVLRRLGWLLLIGLVHLVLLWWGDILHFYVVAGCLLLLLRRSSDKTLLALGIALSLLPPTVMGIVNRLLSSPRSQSSAATRDLLPSLFSGDYLEVLAANLSLYTTHYSLWIWIGVLLWSSGHFLLGYLLGRRRILHSPGRHRVALQRAVTWGLAVGLPINVLCAFYGKLWSVPLVSISFYIGFVALSAAYVAAVALLFESPGWRRRLLWLAPVGRMALTHYLSQSAVYLLVFTGVGLNLYGKIGTAAAILIAVAVFTLQIVFSRWWLKRFRFGPAEWLWRSLTYGRPQPMTVRSGRR